MKEKETSTSTAVSAPVNEAAESPRAPETDKSTKAAKAAKESKNSVLTKVGRATMKRHNLKEVYVTSDGQSFARKSNALAHARNLKDSEVITVK